MHIESIHIKGFRCFDATGQIVELDDLTCLVGPNASGKTAVMAALARMFGESPKDRNIQKTDFHLPPGEELNSEAERYLSLEAKLVFPELEQEDTEMIAIPEFFNQMVVDQPGFTPYCRILLEGVWNDDGTPDGDIEQTLSWILTSDDDPTQIEDSKKKRVIPSQRSKVRVIYIPAARDPYSQIRNTAGTIFGRLLKSLEWDGKDDAIRKILTELKNELGDLNGIKTMNNEIQTAWSKFYDGTVAANVAFEGGEADPSTLLELLQPAFFPDEHGQTMKAIELSDGLRSLFSLSLSLGLYQLEDQLKTKAYEKGFQSSIAEGLPSLTLFAVEEPENHLSPHYLGKVVGQLRKIAQTKSAQVIVSSHSPAIMGRIEPDEVRYFLGGESRTVSLIRRLVLPADSTAESFKYVREAIRGYPELYFSRLIVLGEGPSEEIILRRIFEASGTPLDTYFISVVPLGGRHVNHFWRLLNGLGIPYITLLDLDREKEGAGWGRIQYVRNQLVALHRDKAQNLTFKDTSGTKHNLTEEQYAELSKNDDRANSDQLNAWAEFYRYQFDVFFSSPLDIDFLMLEAFTEKYISQAPTNGGPRLSKSDPDRKDEVHNRMRQVLASDVAKAPPELGSSYREDQVELFPWYKYIFIDRSKPVAHMRAMIDLNDKDLFAGLPESLRALIERAKELISTPQN